ncbi:MAG: recombinase family protein [Candidatus Magasanikbacteria bacterium]
MKYFLYARKSTDEDDRQVLSIESQITELREFGEKEKLEIVDEFIESKTAKIPGRPIFNKMMERIENNDGYGILAWHPDRLARNSVDGGKIIYLVDTGKILGLKFPTFWFDSTPQGKFMLNIAFGQSKYYIDNLSENIKRGLRQKLRRGEMPGKAPVGYLNELRHHTIVRDPVRAPLVAKLFEEYATGIYTLMGIEELSFSLGLISRQTNGPIKFSKLQEMLKNPFYYGVFVYHGEMYQGVHEPIISKQLFDKVQTVITSKAKPRKQKKTIDFAFRGLMTCGECGRAITSEKKIKPSGKMYVYYRCTKKRRICSQKYVEEKELVKQINEQIKKVALSDEIKDNFLRQWEIDNTKYSTKSNADKTKLKTELKTLDEKQMTLLDAYLDRTITNEEYTAVKQKIINRKIEINESLKDKGNNWLGLFHEWILLANQAKNIAVGENLEEKRSFLQKIGSDFRLAGQKVSWLWENSWAIIAENSSITVSSG